MPSTLLLRLKAPMQSWGTTSRFSIRDTGHEPSKSGVIGLLCAALGIQRHNANINNPIFNAMTRLRFGVRVLQSGITQSDYHTAQNIRKADGGKPKDTELSRRWYLADADFIAGLEDENPDLLRALHEAIQSPRWQLFLGRKAFAPSLPVHIGNGPESMDLESALMIPEPSVSIHFESPQRIVVEDPTGNEVRQDVPLCLDSRRFASRRVRTYFIDNPASGGNANVSL